MQPPDVFRDRPRTVRRSALRFCVAYGTAFAQQLLVEENWPGHVRSRSYDVIGKRYNLDQLCGGIIRWYFTHIATSLPRVKVLVPRLIRR